MLKFQRRTYWLKLYERYVGKFDQCGSHDVHLVHIDGCERYSVSLSEAFKENRLTDSHAVVASLPWRPTRRPAHIQRPLQL